MNGSTRTGQSAPTDSLACSSGRHAASAAADAQPAPGAANVVRLFVMPVLLLPVAGSAPCASPVRPVSLRPPSSVRRPFPSTTATPAEYSTVLPSTCSFCLIAVARSSLIRTGLSKMASLIRLAVKFDESRSLSKWYRTGNGSGAKVSGTIPRVRSGQPGIPRDPS